MIIDGLSKISCLMTTVGRPHHVRKSVGCYLNQTYPNRELIIVSQGSVEDDKIIQEHLGILGRHDIRFFDAPSRLSLGAMRNLSCELASGEILCQWDDDDLYHPERLRDQYKALCADNRNVASASTRFLKYFVDSNELYWCDWSGEGVPSSQFLCGSVMFYKKFFYQQESLLYPEVGEQCHVEEDWNVLFKLLDAGRVVPYGLGHHYLYVYHGENTYKLPHHLLTLDINSGKEVVDTDELLNCRPLLESTLKLMGFDKKACVRSLEEVAFTYSPQ